MSLQVLRVRAPGPLSSVQDLGRQGWRAFGVGRSGAVDRYSAAIANRLVGNAEDAALLEITLTGPRLELLRPLTIALTGAEIAADCGGVPLPGWRPARLPAGAELRLGACRRGIRAYLAIAGGLAVPALLDSRATDLRGGFGGLQGRTLREGDVLHARPAPSHHQRRPSVARWWVDPVPDLDLALPAVAGLAPGAAALDQESQRALLAHPFRVAAASNRMGVRLQGPPLRLAAPWLHPSEPVMPGTVQLPPDGQPIVLLDDCGTHGGYPRIGHVGDVDLPRIAQLRPGETLRFAPATLADHDRRACERRVRMARIALAIEQQEQRVRD